MGTPEAEGQDLVLTGEGEASAACPDSSWPLCSLPSGRTPSKMGSHGLLSGQVEKRTSLWPAPRQQGWGDESLFLVPMTCLGAAVSQELWMKTKIHVGEHHTDYAALDLLAS